RTRWERDRWWRVRHLHLWPQCGEAYRTRLTDDSTSADREWFVPGQSSWCTGSARRQDRTGGAMIGSLIIALLISAAPTDPILLVEASVQGEAPEAHLGRELTTAIDAVTPADIAALLNERLPAIVAAAKAEPAIEAGQLVESGRDAYLNGHFTEAVRQ